MKKSRQNVLHITNGDCAVNVMNAAGISGSKLPWDDVLHIGPVRTSDSLAVLSRQRADYLAELNWGSPAAIRKRFEDRDSCLCSFREYDRVVLWFEHDLYDQLQLLQLLDWFSRQDLNAHDMSLICSDRYLGTLEPEELLALVAVEKPVSEEQYLLASKAWAAFCAADPIPWLRLLDQDTTALPYLHGAVIRLLEEYPDSNNGLSRTANSTLSILTEGEMTFSRLFARYQQTEERRFMGDTCFLLVLEDLMSGQNPLLYLSSEEPLSLPATDEQSIGLTRMGQDVLQCRRSWTDLHTPDQWFGGVHLSTNNCWHWDRQNQNLELPAQGV